MCVKTGFDIIEADTTKRTNIKIILEEEREYVKNEVFGRPFEEKVKRFAEIGFSAIQFHDDDVVPNMNDQNGIRYDQDKSFGVEDRDFEALEMYVMELLIGAK